MIAMITDNLDREGLGTITLGALVKFLGITIMMTRVKMKGRREIWNTSERSRYLPAYNFGAIGMSRHCWDQFWKHVWWSEQPPTRPEGMIYE